MCNALHVAVALQFGHGCDAVETAKRRSWTTRLVWSFNSATAVMPWKPPRRGGGVARLVPFNSATAVMPWKLDELNGHRGPPGTLQFGHGCDAVETGPGRRNRAEGGGPFNSATAVMPWKPSADSWVSRTRRSFNSATAVMPGKPAMISGSADSSPALQFGHGCDAVET